MVVLYDKPVPPLPAGPSTPTPPSHPPPAQLPQAPFQTPTGHGLPQAPPRHANEPHPVPSGNPLAFRLPRRPVRSTKAPPSKINLLDLPTETTATIFRHAHKPRDFHFLLPSGAGPLRTRKYNLPLTVSKEWYRRVRPLYYERLRLSWLRIPDFVENVQRYDVARFVQRVDVRVQGSAFYRAIQGRGGEGPGGKIISNAQMKIFVLQYVDLPLMTFGLVLDSLPCLRDLTLRFSDCKGDEVSMQSIASVIANLPPSVENLYLDCAVVAKQSATNPYAVHLCPIIRKHATNLKSMFLSCRYLCQDLFHPDLIPDWQPPDLDDVKTETMSMLEPKPSYPNLEAFTIYREGRHDQTPRPCSEMYLYGIKRSTERDDWSVKFIDYAVQAYKRFCFPTIKRFEIPSNATHPDGKPCSSVFDVLQDDNYWNSNEEIVIDDDEDRNDSDEGWSVPARWWKSKRRGMPANNNSQQRELSERQGTG